MQAAAETGRYEKVRVSPDVLSGLVEERIRAPWDSRKVRLIRSRNVTGHHLS